MKNDEPCHPPEHGMHILRMVTALPVPGDGQRSMVTLCNAVEGQKRLGAEIDQSLT